MAKPVRLQSLRLRHGSCRDLVSCNVRVGLSSKCPYRLVVLPPVNAPGTLSNSILQLIAHEYAGFVLNKWRDVMASLNADDQAPTAFRMARGWEKDADEEVRQSSAGHGFTDGIYI